METDRVGLSKMNRMLIVEDDESQRVTLSHIMVSQGFEVDSCETGSSALEKLRDAHFGVVIVDLRLPDISGTEILDELARLNRSSCVIIHTAYASLESAKNSINRGAFGYIEKGKDPAILVEQVHRAVREHVGRYTAELESAVAERTKSLRQSEERYQDLYENAPEMFLSVEPSGGRVLNCNTTLARKLGRDKKEIIGGTMLDLVAPDCHHVVQSSLETFRDTGEIHDLDMRVACADGSELHVNVSATAVRDGLGRILHSRSVLHDVTERKRDERRLRELQLAVENSGTGIARLDPSGRFVDVHEVYARLLGYDPEELIGMTWEPTVHPDDHTKAAQAVDRMIANEQAEEQVRGIRKDGSECMKRILLVLTRDENGEPSGHYSTLR